MKTNYHQRVNITPQVWGSFLAPGNEGICTFFGKDHWVKGERHSLFIHPYESLPFDKNFAAAISAFATSAVLASASSFSGDTIQLPSIDWYFALAYKDHPNTAWCKVKFKSFYGENLARIKHFPEVNDVSLFGDPEFKWVTKPKTTAIPVSDYGLTAYEYRKQHIESMYLLAQLVDQLHGPLVKIGIWNPPVGRSLDNGHLTLSREDCEFRTLFVRRSKKLLEQDLAKAQSTCAEYKVLLPITPLDSGFFGAVLCQHRVTTWENSNGPEWDEKVFKESRDTKPTWRGVWRTHVHESRYLGEW